MSPRCSVLPPGHPYTWPATSAPTASPRLATSTGAELLSRHRSHRVGSFVTIKTRGDLGAGSLNSKRSAEYAPLGLSRTRASGKEYPDYRGADSLTAEVGHQGEHSAKSGESVRSWTRIKSGVSSRFSSLPHPLLLSSPPLPSSSPLPLLHASTIFIPSSLTFAFPPSRFVLNLLTERILALFARPHYIASNAVSLFSIPLYRLHSLNTTG